MAEILKTTSQFPVSIMDSKMKNAKLGILIATLAAIFLTGEAIFAAESITTKDFWILQDGYSESFTNGGAATVSYNHNNPYFAEDVFLVDYPGPSCQALKYDEDGNLIYYGAEHGPHWVYRPDTPQKFLPNIMEIGQIYTSEWSRKEYLDGSFQGFGSDSFSFTLSGPHTTTVKAGTFTTYILYVTDNWSTSYGESGTSSRIYYLAKKIGWVKMSISGETYDLLSCDGAPPTTPTLSLTTSGTTVSLSWPAQVNTDGYTLFYDQYPWDSPTEKIDMGPQTSASFQLWEGATFCLTIQAYNSFGTSDYSNTEYLILGYSLSVTPESLGFSVGQTNSCTINGGTRPYSANSSDTSVATASVGGNTLSVTGVSPGSATITVSDGDAGSVTVSITVAPSLSVSPTPLFLSAGATSTCTISGGISPYSAGSSDTSVATASVGGGTLSVTGISPGSATITVTDGNSGSITVPITVAPSLNVSPTRLALSVGAKKTCTISGGATPYKASSDDTSVATVSVAGGTLSVTGVAPGTTTITVTDGNSGSVIVSITVAPSLNVSSTRLSLSAGATSTCTISGGLYPYSAGSSNTSVATVSVAGGTLSVTGVAPGTTTITVTDGNSGSVTVSITVVPSLTVDPTGLSLSIDATSTCTISGGLYPYSAGSSNTSVATVSVGDSTLFITAVSAGVATVTVRDSGSNSTMVTVTVEPSP